MFLEYANNKNSKKGSLLRYERLFQDLIYITDTIKNIYTYACYIHLHVSVLT